MNKRLKTYALINCEILNKKLLKNNIHSLKTVQIETLKHEQGNLFIESPTGSGKTLAYLLPIFKYLTENQISGLCALIVAPTRELCGQIASVIISYGFSCSLKYSEDINLSNILVATPGISIFIKKPLRIQFLVLDEGDKLYNGFPNQVRSILKNNFERIFVVSATLNKLDDLIKQINPQMIQSSDSAPKKLTNHFIITDPLSKYDNLRLLIKKYYNGKVIIFFNTCASVDFFHSLFSKKIMNEDSGIDFIKLHGRLTTRETIFSEVLIKDKFILFCTDIAARGIDIENIDCVIHFDIPLDPMNIVHRSGRTARNEKHGVSYLFVMPSELPFVKFLDFKKIVIDEIFFPYINLNYEEIKRFVRENDEVEKDAVRTFVSYLASYKEYVLNYLIEFKKLDFDNLAEFFCLRKIPKMKELKNIVFNKFPRNNKK
ncbi:ATP-dependent rRNA helicase SPB4 [Cucumispora dikerogammari]|nr:ATP-dependent rRNA helicase SPB4 [Cucumispora dikerogammari]